MIKIFLKFRQKWLIKKLKFVWRKKTARAQIFVFVMICWDLGIKRKTKIKIGLKVARNYPAENELAWRSDRILDLKLFYELATNWNQLYVFYLKITVV